MGAWLSFDYTGHHCIGWGVFVLKGANVLSGLGLLSMSSENYHLVKWIHYHLRGLQDSFFKRINIDGVNSEAAFFINSRISLCF